MNLINKTTILNELKKIKPVLESKYLLSELALFGSYSRNEQSETSDIDILVNYQQKNYRNFFNTIEDIQKIFPDTEVQVVMKDGIKPKYFERLKNDLIYV